MKLNPLIIFFIFVSTSLDAQKRPLDLSAYDKWPFIENPEVSSDGSYAIYYITSKGTGTTLAIQATDSSWKMDVPGGYSAIITEDSKHVIFQIPSDSLGILELATKHVIKIPNVKLFNVPEGGDGKWLAYRTSRSNRNLVLRNLWDGGEMEYKDIVDYLFSNDGKTLVMLIDSLEGSFRHSMIWINLANQKTATICQKCNAKNWVFNREGDQLAFVETMGNKFKKDSNIVMYYSARMDSAVAIVDAPTLAMEGMSISNNTLSFSDDGKNLFVHVHHLSNLRPTTSSDTPENLLIWSYQNSVLENVYQQHHQNRDYTAVINLHSSNLTILGSDSVFYNMNQHNYFNNYVLVVGNGLGSLSEYNWRQSAQPYVYLVSTLDGTKKRIRDKIINTNFWFSTGGKYVIWYDRKKGNWFTYSMKSNLIRNISVKIPFPLYRENDDAEYPWYVGIAGWLSDDEAVFIYDRYDIWKVDPNGISPPINITRGYGREKHLQLRYVDFSEDHSLPIRYQDTLLLSSFDLITKENGFMQLVLGNHYKLIKHPMHPKTYYFPFRYSNDFSSESNPFFPLKAKNATVYLFEPMKADEYPNLYVTFDFEKFRPLTNLAPQNAYNWYTSELIHWKLFDGRLAEGILYKPENFNLRKKYPLIFYYYERFGDALHTFLHPEPSRGSLNIPWFVSNGYLVFIPDIYFQIGYPGKSAYNSVVSAARYLSKMPWVNGHKMGLEGHSFGGFETDYIVTRTSIFSAAASADAVSDLISDAGYLRNESGSHEYYEKRQGRIGASLWERPDLYLENSPIFKADKVSTPLLILHNKFDSQVSICQGIEWFTALRRLGKKVWMLQYNDENHSLENEKNKLDYSIRLGQYFDHFLKGTPAPDWMLEAN